MKMFIFQSIIIYFFVISNTFAKPSEECKNTKFEKLPISKIRKDLFCAYQKNVRPVSDQESTVHTEIHMALKHFIFEEADNTLQIHCWMIWQWTDEFLKWDPKDYNDIDQIIVRTYEIWTPDATLYTASQMDFLMQGIGYSRCFVNHLGNVTCIVPTTYSTRCVPNLLRWPYDKHNCSLSLGSWVYNAHKLNITLGGDEVILSEYEPSNDWVLLNSTPLYISSTFGNKSFGWIKFDFSFQRHATVKTYTIVAPALALGLLTLASLWLDAVRHNTSRVVVCCCSLMCHLLFLIYLGTDLPNTGDQCPRIVLFFRDSLILTLITLVVHLIATNMETIWLRCCYYPKLVSIVGWFLASPIGTVFLVFHDQKPLLMEHLRNSSSPTIIADGEDTGGILSNPSNANSKLEYQWKTILLVFERIILSILFSIYCILVLLFWI